MKRYIGTRTEQGCVITVSEGNEPERPLDPRLDLWNHSPSGFEWSYFGSGPAQTSLALLADVLGDDQLAVELHQPYKFRVVSGLPKEGWELTEADILEAADRLRAERGKPDAGDDQPG